MKYIFTKGQKRLQQNMLIQLWRFVVLSIKFMKLTQTDFSRPNISEKPAESGRTTTTEQAPDIKLVYEGEPPTTAAQEISESKHSVVQKAR